MRLFSFLSLLLAGLLLAGLAPVQAQPTPADPKVFAGKYIYSESIGDLEIEDSTAYVDLPVSAWLSATAAALTTSTTPSTGLDTGRPCIFHASGVTSGTMVATLAVPLDYVSGGRLQIAARTLDESTVTTGTYFTISVLEAVADGQVITSTAVSAAPVQLVKDATPAGNVVLLDLPFTGTAMTPGGFVTVRLWRSAGESDVYLSGTRFVYTRSR